MRRRGVVQEAEGRRGGARGRRLPDLESVERRRSRGSARRCLRRLARSGRVADHRPLRHRPPRAGSGGPRRRPVRSTRCGARRHRGCARRQRGAPRGRRVRGCAPRPCDCRPERQCGVRVRPRSRPSRRRRANAPGLLWWRDHGRRWTGAHGRAAADGRNRLAGAILDRCTARARRSHPGRSGSRSSTSRSDRRSSDPRSGTADARDPPGRDVRPRDRRRQLGRAAPRACRERAQPRQASRPA